MPCPINLCEVTPGSDTAIKTFVPTDRGPLNNVFTFVSPSGDEFLNLLVTLEAVKLEGMAEQTGLGLSPSWLSYQLIDEETIGAATVANVEITIDEDAVQAVYPTVEYLIFEVSISNGTSTFTKQFCYTPSFVAGIVIAIVVAVGGSDILYVFDYGEPDQTATPLYTFATFGSYNNNRFGYDPDTGKIFFLDEVASLDLRVRAVDLQGNDETISSIIGSQNKGTGEHCTVSNGVVGFLTTQARGVVNTDGSGQTQGGSTADWHDIAPNLQDGNQFWVAQSGGTTCRQNLSVNFNPCTSSEQGVTTGMGSTMSRASDPASGDIYGLSSTREVITMADYGTDTTGANFVDATGVRIHYGLIGILDGDIYVFHDNGSTETEVWTGKYQLGTGTFTNGSRIDNITAFSGNALNTLRGHCIFNANLVTP